MSETNTLERPLGLVLAGGGSLGSWQAGALSALAQAGLTFDAVMGFSAGALNGSAYAQGMIETARQKWEEADANIIRFSPRLFPLSLLSNTPLRERILIHSTEEECRKNAICRLTLISSAKDRSKHMYAQFNPAPNGLWDAPLREHVVASCAIPIVFPPQQLVLRGEKLTLVDGGVPCVEHISFQELSFCRSVVALEMVRPDELDRRRRGYFANLDQKARRIIRAIMDVGVFSLVNGMPKPKIYRLHPSQILDFTHLHFDNATMRQAVALGAKDARTFLANPCPYKYENQSQAAISS